MTAALIDLVDAVVAELNEPEADFVTLDPVEWSQEFTAAKVYRIRNDLAEQAETLWRVDVALSSEESEFVNRAFDKFTIDIDVAISKRANPDDASTVEPILTLQDEFARYWRARRPDAATDFHCLKRTKLALWIPEHLELDRVCTSVTRLTFEGTIRLR